MTAGPRENPRNGCGDWPVTTHFGPPLAEGKVTRKQKRPILDEYGALSILFLRFLVDGPFLTEFAEFLQFDFPLNFLFILASVVIYPVANRAFQADQVFGKFWFGHIC
jgi:hypothetical protein